MKKYNKYILHIDANSAFLSWTAAHLVNQGDSVDLREIPSVIGGSEKSRHGIVLAKSVPAKKYNIITGEPLAAARKKCPGLVVVPPSQGVYSKASQAMFEIIATYTPTIQRFSIDECFAEFHIEGDRADIEKLAYEIKDRIHAELGFTVNIGVGLNKICAKMGSELIKPNRVHTLWPEELETKLWPLPIGDLFMVGKSTEKKLRELGLNTIGELARFDVKILSYSLKSFAYVVHDYANGIDDSPVRLVNRPVIKGIGNGMTTRHDVLTREEAYLYLMSVSESVGGRLRDAGYCASLISVGYKSTQFVTKSHQRKLQIATDSTTYIIKVVKELFDELWTGEPIRKLHVRVSEFNANDYVQLSMLETFDFDRAKNMDKAIDEIRNRFGGQAIYRARFLNSGVRSGAAGTYDELDYQGMAKGL